MNRQIPLPFGVSFANGAPAQERAVYPHPARVEAVLAPDRFSIYEQLWQFYSNTAFDEVGEWARYKLKYNLYRYTRGVFNPVARIVDFYAENIYPGVLSENDDLPNGVQSAIPLDPTAPKEIRSAIAQLWDWSNWGDSQSVMVTYGALTGNCLVEVIDDIFTGKVYFQPHWSGHVREISLDIVGNVTGYVLEYDVVDRMRGIKYKYGKEVLPGIVRVYIDGKLEGETFNPYPFVPAIWARHINLGSDFGVPAVKSGMPTIDELNSVVSHTSDHIHKQINSPRILWTDMTVKPLFGSDKPIEEAEFDTRKDLMLLKGAKDGKTETLVGNLDPATIIPIVDKLLQEIERNYPEITFYEKLRDQNIVTSVGAKALMGDVAKKIARPAANYDLASNRLFQMALAISGWRASSGAWGNSSNLSSSQRKFLGFGFDTYTAGELAVRIMPRTLVPETTREAADEIEIRARAIAQVADVLPQEEKLRLLGYREDQIPEIMRKAEAERAKAQADALAVEEKSAEIQAKHAPKPAAAKPKPTSK